DLLLHLTPHATLEALAVVDEAGHERVAARRPLRLAREQHPAARGIAHERDHRGMQVRIVLVGTRRTLLAPLPFDARRRRATARTIAARRLPPERLHRHAAEREELVRQLR